MDSKERDKNVVETVEVTAVPYIIFESVQARNERHIKRLWILIIVLVALLFASNMMWLTVFSGYDFETYEVDMDAGDTGDALYNYIGEDGDIYNGEYKNKATENNEAVGLEGENGESQS